MVLTEPSLRKAEHNGAVPGGQREDAHPPRYEWGDMASTHDGRHL